LKKEITKFNSKVESLKKVIKNERSEDIKHIDEDFETNMMELEHNRFTKGAKYVKNKMIVLNVNKERAGNLINSTLKNGSSTSLKITSNNFGKHGVLYKTTTFRNKFSSNNNVALERLLRKSYGNGDHSDSRLLEKEIEEKILNDANKLETDKQKTKQPKLKIHDFSDYHARFPHKIMTNTRTYYNTSTSIFNAINQGKNNFIDFVKGSDIKVRNSDDLLSKKKNFLKNHAMTHYLGKKGDEIPYVFPFATVHQNNYNSYSEKNRYEKVTEQLLKLRYFIQKDEQNEKKYLQEFIMKHNIYDEAFYTDESLKNFMNFLNSDFNINPGRTVREIIYLATSYTGNSEINEINYKTSPNFISHKAKKIIHGKMVANRRENKSGSGIRTHLKEERFSNGPNYSLKPNTILEEKKFKLDLNNPKAIIDGLEQELSKLQTGFIQQKINLNDSIKSGRNDSLNEIVNSEASPIIENTGPISTKKKNTFVLGPVINKKHSTSMTGFRNAKKTSETDLEQLKKKNKLLEYIVLQRSKNKYQLEQDMKKFKITEI
jgi:hypothetical protein